MKKIICVLVALVFLASVIPAQAWAMAPDDYNKLLEEQKKINQQLKATQQNISKVTKEKKNVSKQLEDLDKKLNAAENELGQVEGQLSVLENQIALTQRELERAAGDAVSQKELLKKRVRVMHENGNIGYLSVILDASSFADFVSRIDFLRKIVQFDSDLLSKMKNYRDSVDEKKQQLQSEQEQKEKLKQNLSDKKEKVETAKEDKQNNLKELISDLKELEKQEDKLLEQSNEIGKKIVALQSAGEYIGGTIGWPAPGYYKITSPYGYRTHPILKKKKLHTGIDIAVPKGSKIIAANAGKVIYAGYYGGYGYAVIIDHGGKISTLYAHNDKLLVKEGDEVEKGQTIAKSGSTGLSTGPHLHFEVRENGQHVDPMKHLKGK